MLLLLLASVLWAFSPGLIKQAGFDAAFLAAARLGIALAVFLPFLRWRGLTSRTAWTLAGIGALQFGFMYLAYNESYRYLKSYEVILFTLTSPILVTLLADLFDRKLRARALLAAFLAVIGSACIVANRPPGSDILLGFLLVQLANTVFALGQVLYRRVRLSPAGREIRDRDVFALLYAGAFAVTLPVTLLHTNFSAQPFTATNVAILIYLGAVPSGIGFFLWNRGSTRVSAGTLAVMNNAKIPLGILVSLLIFHETAEPWRLIACGVLMGAAVWLAEERK